MARDNATPEPGESKPRGSSPQPEGGSNEGLPALPEELAVVHRALGDAAPDLALRPFPDRLELLLPAERLVETCRVLRDEQGFGMLTSVTAVDWKDSFELAYHLHRLDSPYPIVIRCALPHEEPRAPTLVPLWAGADFQEREIYDLMGIVFTGHPNLRRILLDDDFPGHPLRKDFEQDPDYVLVRHLRVPGYSGPRAGEASTGRFPVPEASL